MSSAEQNLSPFEMLWEIPLSILSFVFYKVMKLSLRQVARLYCLIDKQQSFRWRVTSGEMLERFMTLPFVMTVGPRWNTHAITPSVGPLKVKKSLSLQVAAADKSARAWTAVIYSFPKNRTLTVTGSLDSQPEEEEWRTFELKPGKYLLVLRYYQWSENVELPAVEVDGLQVVKAKTIPADVNNFYQELPKRRSFFYLCLHYYVFVLLSLRHWLPQTFTEKEYLPVGNPETQFCYGAIRKGRALHFELDEPLLTTHDVYLTVYTRDSFPAFWYQITEREHLSLPSAHDGFYLVRLHRRIKTPDFLVSDKIKITVM